MLVGIEEPDAVYVCCIDQDQASEKKSFHYDTMVILITNNSNNKKNTNVSAN